MPISDGYGWYGSSLLAAAIPDSGKWIGVGAAFGNKFWWWREGYSAAAEPSPDLTIRATKLIGNPEFFEIKHATSAMGIGGDWEAMLVGMSFPSPGCWEIRGTYQSREELILILEVGENSVDV